MTDRRDLAILPPVCIVLIAAGLIMVGGGLLAGRAGDCQGATQSDAMSPADIDTSATSTEPKLKGTQ